MSTEHTPGEPLGRAMTAEEFNWFAEVFNGIYVQDIGDKDDKWATYGHQDKAQMVEAVIACQNPEFWETEREKPTVENVEHAYWVNAEWWDYGLCAFDESHADAPDAFPVTVVRV